MDHFYNQMFVIALWYNARLSTLRAECSHTSCLLLKLDNQKQRKRCTALLKALLQGAFTSHIVLYNPFSHPNDFYWGHQCSWTLIPANSMEVPNMKSYDWKEVARPKARVKPTSSEKSRLDGGSDQVI